MTHRQARQLVKAYDRWAKATCAFTDSVEVPPDMHISLWYLLVAAGNSHLYDTPEKAILAAIRQDLKERDT